MPPASTCPWNHRSRLSSSVLPCAAVRNLLGGRLCGFLCIGVTCVGFPRPPKFTLCAVRLLRTCLGVRGPLSVPELLRSCSASPGLPSARDLCALISCYRLHSLLWELFVLSAVLGRLCGNKQFLKSKTWCMIRLAFVVILHRPIGIVCSKVRTRI